MEEKRARLLTGIGIALVVYGVLFFSEYTFVITTAASILAAFSAYENLHAIGMEKEQPLRGGLIMGVIACVWLPLERLAVVFAIFVALMFGLFGRMIQQCANGKPMKKPKSVLVSLCIAMLFRAIPALRHMESGLFYLMIAITTCFLTDAAAYHIGKRFGKHQLLALVSPHKTLEGAIGGTIGCLLLMLILKQPICYLTATECSWFSYGLSISLLSLTAQFGDLAMSALKRNYGLKDFGSVFPGHGGVLDRFDSHLFSVALLFTWLLFMPGFAVPVR